MCNKVRDFLLLPFFPIGEEHKDAVTLTACHSHKLDMCAGTIRVLASGSFAVCLRQRGTKQQPWIPTGMSHGDEHSSPRGTAPWPDCSEQAAHWHVCNAPGAWAEDPKNTEARKATGPSIAGLKTVGLFPPSAVLLYGWEMRQVAGLHPSTSAWSQLSGEQFVWTSSGSMLWIHCKYKCLHSKNTIGAG